MKYIAHCKLKNFTTSNLEILFDFLNLIEFYSDYYGDLIFIESIPSSAASDVYKRQEYIPYSIHKN